MTERPDSSETSGLDRRLFMFRGLAGAAAVLGVVSVGTVAAPQPAQAQWTGRTDRDPYDAAGAGIRRRRVRVTDRDPYDAPGQGIRRRVIRRRVTDRDPYDAPGRGIRGGW
jgi:hypothetical protein